MVKHRKNKANNSKIPLFYREIEQIINTSYNPLAFVNQSPIMRVWLRAWMSLAYTLFIRGDDLISINSLKVGVDDSGDPCLQLKFFDRKFFTVYNEVPPVLYIPPNAEEPALNCFKYISEY